MDYISYVEEKTLKYSEDNGKNKRKKSGQFFTPASVVNFMGDMMALSDKEELNILDAGSGTGILTAAVLQKLNSR